MTACHVLGPSEAHLASVRSLAQTGQWANPVINYTAKLISQQSIAPDRWKAHIARRKQAHVLPLTVHTQKLHARLCCSSVAQCLCRATAQLHSLPFPTGEGLDFERRRKKMLHGNLLFFLLHLRGLVEWGSLVIVGSLMQGRLYVRLPCCLALVLKLESNWRRHCRHIYFATIPACQRSW